MKKLKIYLLIGSIALGSVTGPLHASRFDLLSKIASCIGAAISAIRHGPELVEQYITNREHPKKPMLPSTAQSVFIRLPTNQHPRSITPQTISAPGAAPTSLENMPVLGTTTKIGMLLLGTAAIIGCSYVAYRCYFQKKPSKH